MCKMGGEKNYKFIILCSILSMIGVMFFPVNTYALLYEPTGFGDANGFSAQNSRISNVYVAQMTGITGYRLLSNVNQIFYESGAMCQQTKENKLRVCYEYMLQNCVYRKGSLVSITNYGWEEARGARFLDEKAGNCCDWAAGFYYLAQKCGLQLRICLGYVKYRNGKIGSHGWVEIVMNGICFIFDPEMEWSYSHRIKNGAYDGWKRGPRTEELVYWKRTALIHIKKVMAQELSNKKTGGYL